MVEHLSADVTLDTAGENRTSRSETWVLRVQGWARVVNEHPTDLLYNLKAATEHRLARTIQTNGGGGPLYPQEYFLGLHRKNVTMLTIGPGGCQRPDLGGFEYAVFLLLAARRRLGVRCRDPFVEG